MARENFHASSWARQGGKNPNQIVVGVNKDGIYDILITAAQADHCATHDCPQEVEYIPETPEVAPSFPNM